MPIPSALSVVEVAANPSKITPVMIQALRGLRPIELAIFDQVPVIT
ncbi:unannotated protein [freshwater metagenome]|uniref:Unannotated protein n=1 Tax=freshwater metagenome TaxID=449393 RepID=A0A6J6VW38_9ZZZZ